MLSGLRHLRAAGARRHGFTATELLVVVLILGILMVLAFSGMRAIAGQANRAGCAANLSRIGQVLRSYALDYGGRYVETGAASTLGGGRPCGGEFPDTWDSPGTGCWPDDRHTGNAGCLYLLVRLNLLSPCDFICPASGDRDAFGPASDRRFSFLAFRPGTNTLTTEQQLFLQRNATRHCSYSYQNMLGHFEIAPDLADPEAGLISTHSSPPELAILADHNPYTEMRGENRERINPDVHPEANSLNHGGQGQNVLYLSGSVVWHATPRCGAKLADGSLDHIYLPSAGRVDDPQNVPRHVRDSYLVP